MYLTVLSWEYPELKERSTWHGIWQILCFARRHWLLIVLTFVFMAAYASAEGAYLYIMRPFITAFAGALNAGKETLTDGGAAVQQAAETARFNAEDLYYWGWLALVLAPVVALTALAKVYTGGWVLWRLVSDIRDAVCGALMPQSLSFFEERRSGDLMSRITNDVGRSQQAFRFMFVGIPEQFFHLLMGIGIAAWASWQLLLCGVVAVPFIIGPIVYLAGRIRRYSRQGLEKLSDLTEIMSQMFSGIRVIKAFKMEDAETQEFQRCNRKFLGKMMKSTKMRGLSTGVLELVIRSFIAVGILLGTWMVARNLMNLESGRLFVFLGGVYYAFNAVRKLVKTYNQLQETIPAADRVLELLQHKPTLQDAPDAVSLDRVEKGIAFRDVSFRYDTEPVLQNVTFEVPHGETVALIGRSGVGKSTLVALLARFYDVTDGAVEIDGLDIRRITRDSLLDRIAVVAQQTFLFNRSIAENIRYGRRDATDEEVEEAAKAANVHDFIVSLPESYNSMCGEFGAKLSGGQRQRIAIARAILKNPDLLILDEAMAGLDAESESLVREALSNLMHGRTTFVITHDLQTIQNADRILVLGNGGRLIAQGTHDQLMAGSAEYRTLYGLQL